MRKTRSAQLEIGAVPIENIHAGARPRDDIPAILIGLRHFYASQPLRRMLGHSPVLGHLRVADGDRQRVAAESEAAVGDRAAGGRVGAYGGRKKAWRAVARAGRFVLRGDRRALSDRCGPAAGRGALRGDAGAGR